MHSLSCPKCGNVAMSALAKSCLGPARSVKCRTCGARIGLMWLPAIIILLLVSFLPLLAGLVVMSLGQSLTVLSPTLSAVLFAFGMVLTAALCMWSYHRFVPIVAREP